MREDSAEIFFQPFSVGVYREQFSHWQGCPLFDVVHPAFPPVTKASPTLQGVLKDGFGEAVVACGMSEPYEFPSYHSKAWKKFLPTHQEVDLAPYPVAGLVLQVEDAEKFPRALGVSSLHPLLRIRVSRCGLAVRRQAGKQEDFGSTRFSSPFSSKIVVYGLCLVTLPTQLMKH